MSLAEPLTVARRRPARRLTALLLGTALAVTGGIAVSGAGGADAAAAADCTTVPWMDRTRSAEDRATALLAASSQHQKYRWLVEQPANDPTRTEWIAPTAGSSDPIENTPVVYPAQVECTPLVIYANGPEGVHNRAGTTAWPAPIALAASWNMDLAEAKAAAHGSESFDSRSAVVLGPGISSARNPLSGRAPEYFGEDPLLSGLSAAANVRGLEEGNPDKPVLANVKHYLANEQELDRSLSSSNIDERTLRQAYDLPFEIAVKESDPDSMMCSYNQINGVYACENELLTTNLRGEMGFTGYVMSDFGAVHSTAPSLMAGLDQELNRPRFFTPAKLDRDLADGAITQARIDDAAFNVVRAYIRAGLFDNPVPATAVTNTSTPEHKALALQAAEEGTVLLKNDDDALPLGADALTVAVIGQTASTTPTDGVSARQGCSQFRPFGTEGIVLNCDAVVDPLTAITAKVDARGGNVIYDSGADPAAAAATAAAADVAVVFGHHKMGEINDLPNLSLSVNGNELIEAVAGQADDTIVVLNSGTAVEMPWLDDVDAVLHAWYSGEQGGVALANLLFGDANPSGKLPLTIPASLADSPVGSSPERAPGVFADGSTERPAGSTEIRDVNYSEGLEVGYKWYDANDIEPLYEFGYGLSYTEFAYSDLELITASTASATSTTAVFTVTNTGDSAGDEVAQVYLTLPDAADEPGKRLVGFERLSLAPGASQRVEVVIDSSASNQPYSIWDVDAGQWRIVSGELDVEVGASSRDIRLQQSIVLDLDDIAPVVSLTADPAAPDGEAGWYVSPVNVDASATDDTDPDPAVEVDVDAAGWTPYTGTIALTTDGEHTVSARATDAAGNVSDVVSVGARIDRTVPEISATSDVEGRLITLDASDATSGVATVEYGLVDAAGEAPDSWLAYTGPIAVTSGDLVAFRATDVAGNTSAVEYAQAIPVPRISVQPDSARPGDRVTVTGSGIPAGEYSIVLRSDPVTVASATVSASGALTASFVVPRTTTQGAHTVQLVAQDGTVVASAALNVVVEGGLAATGSTFAWAGAIAAALLLILVGAALLIRRRVTER